MREMHEITRRRGRSLGPTDLKEAGRYVILRSRVVGVLLVIIIINF